MSWPSIISLTNLEDGTKDAGDARSSLNNLVLVINQVITSLGEPGGACDLNSDTYIPLSRLPFVVNTGSVASDGTGSGLPSGWSSSKLATGSYRLTASPSRGNALYPFCVPTTAARSIYWVNKTSSPESYDFESYDLTTGSQADTAFNFILFEFL